MSAAKGALLGMVFGLGLAVSGMTEPATVLAFLDFLGNWDPSLAFVMAGAIAVYAPIYRYKSREVPWENEPPDAQLVVGAAVFGVGWGLSGFCPGPALVSAGTGATVSIVFALSMIAGMALFLGYQGAIKKRRAPP